MPWTNKCQVHVEGILVCFKLLSRCPSAADVDPKYFVVLFFWVGAGVLFINALLQHDFSVSLTVSLPEIWPTPWIWGKKTLAPVCRCVCLTQHSQVIWRKLFCCLDCCLGMFVSWCDRRNSLLLKLSQSRSVSSGFYLAVWWLEVSFFFFQRHAHHMQHTGTQILVKKKQKNVCLDFTLNASSFPGRGSLLVDEIIPWLPTLFFFSL